MLFETDVTLQGVTRRTWDPTIIMSTRWSCHRARLHQNTHAPPAKATPQHTQKGERSSANTGVPGEIKRSRDLRGGRWSWTLTFAQKIMSREVELGWASWTSFASSCPSCSSTAVQRTLSLWLCPAQQLKEQLHSAQVAGQWRGDTALTLPLFWRRSNNNNT